jgi:hypothetical protein
VAPLTAVTATQFAALGSDPQNILIWYRNAIQPGPNAGLFRVLKLGFSLCVAAPAPPGTVAVMSAPVFIADADRILTFEPVAPTTDFAITFPVFSATGFDVTVAGVPRTDWTFVGTFDTSAVPNTCTNGVIRFTPGVTGKVVIAGDTPATRPNSFQYQDGVGVPPRSFNAALNLLTALLRELRTRLKSTVRLPAGHYQEPLDPTTEDGRFLMMRNGQVRGADGGALVDAIEQGVLATIDSRVMALKRPLSTARATATAEDLKAAPAVKSGQNLVTAGKTIIGTAIAGVVGKGSLDLSTTNEKILQAKTLVETVMGVSPFILVGIAGAVAIYFGKDFIWKEIQGYREGRHV